MYLHKKCHHLISTCICKLHNYIVLYHIDSVHYYIQIGFKPPFLFVSQIIKNDIYQFHTKIIFVLSNYVLYTSTIAMNSTKH